MLLYMSMKSCPKSRARNSWIYSSINFIIPSLIGYHTNVYLLPPIMDFPPYKATHAALLRAHGHTVCPRSYDPFYFKLLLKMGHYFLDTQ